MISTYDNGDLKKMMVKMIYHGTLHMTICIVIMMAIKKIFFDHNLNYRDDYDNVDGLHMTR